MTSRRQFIQKAGLLGAMGTIPRLSLAEIGTDNSLASVTRKQLLIPAGKIYLNTGSLGPSPQSVIDDVFSATRQLESDPVSENWGALGEKMEAVRKKVADFIHAETDEILLTRNATEGLSLISQSLALHPGDEILTTTFEHGGCEVGLDFLVKMRGAVLKRVELPVPPDNEAAILQAIEGAISPRTRMLVLSHVNTITGLVMPMGKVAQMVKDKGIFFVADGAQAPGQIPIDVKDLGVDAYAASGHKWLLGPKETGFLYLRKQFQDQVHPVFSFSGYAAYSASSGTRNVATIIGLGAAIDWHNAIGVENIQLHCRKLKRYCQDKLKQVQGIRIISSDSEVLSAGMTSFILDRAKNTDVYNQLRQKGIIVKTLPAQNAVRISCHVFVSSDDIDKFISALKPLV